MKQEATKKLKDLVDIIQLKTKKTQAEIAESVGRSPARLSIALNGKIDAEPWLVKLTTVYADILPKDQQAMPKISSDKLIKQNLAYSKVLLAAIAELLAKDKDMPVLTMISHFNKAVESEAQAMGL